MTEILNERARNVLRILVREYVQTGRPVGSRRLAKLHPENLSAATLRNVMSDLEEMGYLAHLHTSSGRIPSGKGYRFYVDELLGNGGISTREAGEIRRSLEVETDPDRLMSKASRLLSVLSRNVGFVLAPPLGLTAMKHIEFVRLSSHRVLVILVTRGGLVQHRLLQISEDLSQAELDQAGRYLVTHFEGRTLMEIRDELGGLMSEERAQYDRMLRTIVMLGSVSLVKDEESSEAGSEVYVRGASLIMEKAELGDVSRMIPVLKTIEEKTRLVRLVGDCLKTDQEEPTVIIGLEKHLPGLCDWALISSPFLYDRQATGRLGILGPTRMEYDRAISLVDYVARLFGKIFNSN